jgi:ketosteroid isomerase-like protein
MKRNVLSAALVVFGLVMVLSLAGCQRAEAPTNLADGHAATASPTPEKIDTAAIQAEIIKLERDWAGAVKNRDAETVRRVLADDAVIVYADGVVATKADEVKSVESGAVVMESWDLLDPRVTVLDANNAFVTGRGVIKGKSKAANMKDEIDISGEYRILDIYARRNGKWQAVASQTTQIRKSQ